MTKAEKKRYKRQVMIKSVGRKGQTRIKQSTVVIAGCGAVGSACANSLARSGVGSLRLVDRYILTLGDLQECSLYDERAVENSLPKAVALGHILRSANNHVNIEHEVEDLNSGTAERLLEGADLIVDAGVSMETRFLINDYSVRYGVPWIYGGVTDTTGMVIQFDGRSGGCLRCILPDLPFDNTLPPASITRGLLGGAAMTAGAAQAVECLHFLAEGGDYKPGVIWFDLWTRDFRFIKFSRREECPCCVRNKYSFLGRSLEDERITSLGRKRFQIIPFPGRKPHIGKLYTQLRPISGNITFNDQLLIVTLSNCTLLIFKDGRIVIEGAGSSDEARSLFEEHILNAHKEKGEQESDGFEG